MKVAVWTLWNVICERQQSKVWNVKIMVDFNRKEGGGYRGRVDYCWGHLFGSSSPSFFVKLDLPDGGASKSLVVKIICLSVNVYFWQKLPSSDFFWLRVTLRAGSAFGAGGGLCEVDAPTVMLGASYFFSSILTLNSARRF